MGLHDDAIEAVTAGWSRYVREHVPPALLADRLILVRAEAIMFVAPMSEHDLRAIYPSKDEAEIIAYRFAPMLRSIFRLPPPSE